MTPEQASGQRAEVSGTLPLFRWLSLVGLLILELVFLSTRFDLDSLAAEADSWWLELLRQTPWVARVVISVAAALVLFAGVQVWHQLQQVAPTEYHRHRWWLFLTGHLAAVLVFGWMTWRLFENADTYFARDAAGLVVWTAAGLATLLLWALALLPPRVCLTILRNSLRPLALAGAIGTAAWLLSRFTPGLWDPLGVVTVRTVRFLIGLLFPVTVDGPEPGSVGTPDFNVDVGPECSGYEGIGLIAAFLVLYLCFGRAHLRFPHALLLLPLGTVIMWLTNVARISLLVALGAWGYPEIALGGFHSQAGWLAFNAVALGTIFLTQRLSFFSTRVIPAAVPGSPGNATLAYLAPFLAILAATMVGQAFQADWDWLYPLRPLAAATVVLTFRDTYARIDWRFSWFGILMGSVAFAVWILLDTSHEHSSASAAALEGALQQTGHVYVGIWLLARCVGSVVLVPFAEELAFRGYLTRRLIASDFTAVPPGQFSWLGFLASSLLFGLLHGSWLAGTCVGALYALAYYRQGRLGEAVVAHGVTNALLAGLVLWTGRWHYWS